MTDTAGRPIRTAGSLTVHLVRHGEARKNLAHVHGAGDQTLTPRGVEQLAVVAARLAAHRDGPSYPLVLHQPEERAALSASLVAADLGLETEVVEGLSGVRMGVTYGLSDEEVRVHYPGIARAQEAWRAGESKELPVIPGAEGLDAFATRIRSALDLITQHHVSRRHAILVCTTSTLNMLSHLLQNDGVLRRGAYSFAAFDLGSLESWRLNRTPPVRLELP